MTTDHPECGCSDSGQTPADPGGRRPPSAALKRYVEEQLPRHREHFLRPSAEFRRSKGAILGFEASEVDDITAIIACLDSPKHLKFHPIKRFDLGIYEDINPFIRRVTPKTLDHLKELVGVPNSVYRGMQSPLRATMQRSGVGACGCNGGARLRPVEMRHLVGDQTLNFRNLSADQRVAVHHLAYNLLMGYADPDLVQKPPYRAVVDFMLHRAFTAHTFVGKDLIVCSDDTVTFEGFTAVYFDNVIVYGGGRIYPGHQTKFHAHHIKHV